MTNTKPYFIRALLDWCGDNNLTPYVLVKVGKEVRVPKEYVNAGEITLNLSVDATSSLRVSNEFLEFKARFGGISREIVVPIEYIKSIYAKENGVGMGFELSIQHDGTETSIKQLCKNENGSRSGIKPELTLATSGQVEPIGSSKTSTGMHSKNSNLTLPEPSLITKPIFTRIK